MTKRKIRKILEELDCRYLFSKKILENKFTGSVIPNELLALLNSFSENPCIDTAVDLLVFDEKFLAFFQLSRKDGLAASTWQAEEDDKIEPFPSDRKRDYVGTSKSWWVPLLKVTLDSGRVIYTDDIHIHLTYADLDELDVEDEKSIQEANKITLNDYYPIETLWKNWGGVTLNQDYLFGLQDKTLPMYCKSAFFLSKRIPGILKSLSALTIRWYEQKPYPFISDENMEHLKKIEWDKLAVPMDLES